MKLSRRTALGLAGLGTALAAGWAVTRARGTPAEEAYPPLGQIVEAKDARGRGAKIHLLSRGPEDAPAVVLIHGASGNVRDFAFAFMDALTPRYRAIAIDRPGFGHSERGPEDAYRPDVQAQLMRGALSQLGVTRTTLVGHSWGAAPALSWALEAPETARGVVGLGGVMMPWPGSAGVMYDIGATKLIGDVLAAATSAMISESRARALINGIFAPQSPPDGYAEYVGAGLALRKETLRANAEDIAYLKSFLAAQRLRYPTLRPPLELLHGDADAIVPARVHSAPMSREAPIARLTLLPGIGHMPHHGAPEACVAAIDRIHALSGDPV